MDEEHRADVQVQALEAAGWTLIPPRCRWCGDEAKGFATINDERFCHEGESPTCYEKERLVAAVVSEAIQDRLRDDE